MPGNFHRCFPAARTSRAASSFVFAHAAPEPSTPEARGSERLFREQIQEAARDRKRNRDHVGHGLSSFALTAGPPTGRGEAS